MNLAALPTSIVIGPFTFYLYGFGLAIAAWMTYGALQRRLRVRTLDVSKWPLFASAVIGSGLLGARAAHVATNWSYYQDHLGSLIAVWQGGLASFGGIAAALPVALVLARRWWPNVSILAFADVLIPAIVAGWAIGRALGPQFMYAGGGHATQQWFGLPYAGQSGRRVPVPLIQALEDGLLWFTLLRIEHRQPVAGRVTSYAMMIWGMVRFFDERWLLGEQGHAGSLGVQLASLVLVIGGVALWIKSRRSRHNLPN